MVGKEEMADRVVLAITPFRRNKRLEEKRGRQLYQSGLVADSASKRKALHTEHDTGISKSGLNIFNIITDDMLLSLANTCDINMECNTSEHTHNLARFIQS